jgi:hypothetical protein
MPVRIATFNCENLFSRAKILDMNETAADFAAATAALKAAEQLRAVLRIVTKEADAASDHAAVVAEFAL